MAQFLDGDVTRHIIGACCEVQKILGYGFLEKVYENALAHELGRQGRKVLPQMALEVRYKGVVVGQYSPDLLVENRVIVELKSEKEIHPRHQAQLLNYLKATGIHVGILVNFGEQKCEWKRMVL